MKRLFAALLSLAAALPVFAAHHRLVGEAEAEALGQGLFVLRVPASFSP